MGVFFGFEPVGSRTQAASRAAATSNHSLKRSGRQENKRDERRPSAAEKQSIKNLIDR